MTALCRALHTCRLMYNEGTEDESFEWIDFRELAPTELRIDWALPQQWPPVSARTPSEVSRMFSRWCLLRCRLLHRQSACPGCSLHGQSRRLSVHKIVAERAALHVCLQKPVPTLVGFLRAGITPQELHSMVDQAAASLMAGAMEPGPMEPPSLQPLPAGTGAEEAPLHTFKQADLHTAAAEGVAGERRGHQGTHGGESSSVKVHPVRCMCVTPVPWPGLG